MVHFYTPLVLSLLLSLSLLLFYSLYICSKNICPYVVAVPLPGILARGAFQGYEKHFLPIWHVPKFKFIIAWRLYFIAGYHIVAWRFSRLCCCHIDAWSSPRILQGYKNTHYQFDMCPANCINKTYWFYPAFISWLQLKSCYLYRFIIYIP